MTIATLDLFSGIGGFSYALKEILSTIAYCEIDPTCQQILTRNMNMGGIDKAPIYDNVETLHVHQAPKMITAGFPCTDISIANPNGKGINGPKSKLFFHICRLIDELPSVEYVFMENSSNIVKRGLGTVMRALKKRGFKLVWRIFDSRDYGALHSRKRWFCLAYKNNLPGVFIKDTKPLGNITAKQIVKKNPQHVARCKVLGNSVIPHVVAVAWNTLNGALVVEETHKHVNIAFKIDDTLATKTKYSTPTYSGWIQHRKYCKRAETSLINQIMYSDLPDFDPAIQPNYRDRYYSVNAVFIEKLMGYPADWTGIRRS